MNNDLLIIDRAGLATFVVCPFPSVYGLIGLEIEPVQRSEEICAILIEGSIFRRKTSSGAATMSELLCIVSVLMVEKQIGS